MFEWPSIPTMNISHDRHTSKCITLQGRVGSEKV